MSERKFKLLNADGAEFNLNNYYHAWLHDPTGLGWAMEPTNVKVGDSFVTLRSDVATPQPEGEIIFNGYKAYKEFLDFIQVGGCILAYMPISTWYYLDVDVQLEKTEIKPENDRLVSSVSFAAKSYWYEALRIFQAEGEITGSDKSYDYTYGGDGADGYHYGNLGQGLMEIENGNLSSYFVLHILGPVTNPEYTLFKDGQFYKSGRVNVTIDDGHELIINTHPGKMEIADYYLNGRRYRDVYGNSDFSTERIFALPPGNTTMSFASTGSAPKAYMEVRKRV